MNPLVSIVLSTYKGEKYLAEQIDSILNQTYQPFELVISDDASTDGTRELLKKYEGNPFVRIFYQPENIGLTRSFEFACDQSKGSLIAFSDQDDIWKPEKIEKLVSAIGNHPLVYSDSFLVDENGNGQGKKLSDLKRMYTGEDSRGYVLYSCVWGHGMMITKAFYEMCKPFPPGIHYDSWIAFRAFMYGGIKYVNEVLTLYRRHDQSTSQTLPPEKKERHTKTKKQEYHEKLAWIGMMQQFERREEYKGFYKRLLQLYTLKGAKRYVFSLIPFMLKNRKALFRYSRKGFVSHFVEIWKQAKGAS
jgi:glycosyltransferase involved in cell wall biosynthesis